MRRGIVFESGFSAVCDCDQARLQVDSKGAAVAQTIQGGSLMGGGSQVFIPNVNPAWLVR